jgi:hypothetical protein
MKAGKYKHIKIYQLAHHRDGFVFYYLVDFFHNDYYENLHTTSVTSCYGSLVIETLWLNKIRQLNLSQD